MCRLLRQGLGTHSCIFSFFSITLQYCPDYKLLYLKRDLEYFDRNHHYCKSKYRITKPVPWLKCEGHGEFISDLSLPYLPCPKKDLSHLQTEASVHGNCLMLF